MGNWINRRSFLQMGAASGLAVTGLSLPSIVNSKPGGTADQAVKRYKTLGRTGMQVADISFGSSRLRMGEERLVQHAFDQGINYFDTAESYTDGASETVIGNALKGKRDKVYLATKMHVGASTTANTMMGHLNESLRRLKTDDVDVFFNHAVNDVDRLKNPEWFEFVEKAKRQGKFRFTGMSGHGGYLEDCVNYATEQDMFDVMLLSVNFGEDPSFYDRLTRSFDFVANQNGLPAAIKRAKDKDTGIVAMKVLRGAKLNDMRPYETNGATFSQAAFRWILDRDYIDNLIVSMTSIDRIDEYLGASGTHEVTDVDMELLGKYAEMNNMSYCRQACNDCESSCPYGVQISDVLRTRMYALDYGDVSFAKSDYSKLATDASPCLSCDGSPCQDACTHGLPIADLCGPTHQLLS